MGIADVIAGLDTLTADLVAGRPVPCTVFGRTSAGLVKAAAVNTTDGIVTVGPFELVPTEFESETLAIDDDDGDDGDDGGPFDCPDCGLPDYDDGTHICGEDDEDDFDDDDEDDFDDDDDDDDDDDFFDDEDEDDDDFDDEDDFDD